MTPRAVSLIAHSLEFAIFKRLLMRDTSARTCGGCSRKRNDDDDDDVGVFLCRR